MTDPAGQSPHVFEVYPAIDLRAGQVVRLVQGDPSRTTIYATDPAEVAEKWCRAGARWLHVVNLDGAFGERSTANLQALKKIQAVAHNHAVRVQFGGGIRTQPDTVQLLDLGISRIVIGTLAVQDPAFIKDILQAHGSDRVAVGLDARHGSIQTHGWTQDSGREIFATARVLKSDGLKWLIYTDIVRDGTGSGLALDHTIKLQQATGLSVIASGGVSQLVDIQQAKSRGLLGVIVGRALYENHIDLPAALRSLGSGTG